MQVGGGFQHERRVVRFQPGGSPIHTECRLVLREHRVLPEKGEQKRPGDLDFRPDSRCPVHAKNPVHPARHHQERVVVQRSAETR